MHTKVITKIRLKQMHLLIFRWKLIINSTYFGSEFYDQSYFVELNSDEEVYIFGKLLIR